MTTVQKPAAVRTWSRDGGLQDLLDAAGVGLLEVSPGGDILWANVEFRKLVAEDCVGRPLAQFVLDADPSGLALLAPDPGRAPAPQNQPARLRAADGSIREVLLSATPTCENGKLVLTRCLVLDVTEQARGKDAQALLAAIVDSSDDAIVTKSLDGIISSWNGAAERLFGYSTAEAVGQPITLVIPPELHDEERDILARLRRGETIDHYETERVTKQGARIAISLTISPVRDDRGRIIGASKIARNITDRRRADAALRDSEERYRRLTELLPVAVYTCEAPSGEIGYFNDCAVDLWGRQPRLNDPGDRFCGSWRLYQKDGTRLPHEQCPMAVALRDGKSFRNREVIIERPGGSRLSALVNVEPIRDATGRITGAINVCLDISALKRAEERLKEADRRKNEFLATLSHELRNPLAPLRHALEILKLGPDDPGLVQESRQTMERQVAHLVRLINDLLDVSRITHDKLVLRKEPVALANLVEQAVASNRPLIDACGHTLTVSLPDEPVWLDADSVRLVQVLDNLISNACRYMEPGGEVRLLAQRRHDGVEVRVADAGHGIAADDLENIFEMFSQSELSGERAQGGLGVGLTLVRRLAEMHGGSVCALSAGPGQGSEFVLSLPVIDGPGEEPVPEPTATTEADPQAETGTRHRVLVVDDNGDSAASLAALLSMTGYDTHCAYDGPEAVSAAEAFRPALILLDIGLPGMDGYEVCRKVRSEPWGTGMAIVAISGRGQERDLQRSQREGFDAHLIKPVDFPELQTLLETLTRQHSTA